VLRRCLLIPLICVFVLAIALTTAVLLFRRPTPDVFKQATADIPIALPRDAAAHFDYQSEWWYYTGHLLAEEGTRYGFEVVFFKVYLPGWIKVGPLPINWVANPFYLAHFAVTNEEQGTFTFAEETNFPDFWSAGAKEEVYSVWNGDWSVKEVGGKHLLKASMEGYAIDLELKPLKPHVLHGDGGISPMGEGGASYYYSYTRMRGRGTLNVAGTAISVEATAWMDHQWGSWDWGGFAGWDWFSIRLNDGRELMLFEFLDERGLRQEASGGTIIFPDGRFSHLSFADYSIEVLEHWTSPNSHVTYPAGWRVLVPKQRIELEVWPVLSDQELIVEFGGPYWEGSVTVKGKWGGIPVVGVGYVELVGYD